MVVVLSPAAGEPEDILSSGRRGLAPPVVVGIPGANRGLYPVMAATMIMAMPMMTEAMTMASATF
jgi:hypothetical protein